VGNVCVHIVHFYRALQSIKTHRDRYTFDDIVSGKYWLEDFNEALTNMALGKEIEAVIDNRGR